MIQPVYGRQSIMIRKAAVVYWKTSRKAIHLISTEFDRRFTNNGMDISIYSFFHIFEICRLGILSLISQYQNLLITVQLYILGILKDGSSNFTFNKYIFIGLLYFFPIYLWMSFIDIYSETPYKIWKDGLLLDINNSKDKKRSLYYILYFLYNDKPYTLKFSRILQMILLASFTKSRLGNR